MAEEQDNSQEKTEEASQKRLDDAKQKGQVSRSRELNSMALLLCTSASLLLMGDAMLNSLSSLMHDNFSIEREHLFDETVMFTRLLEMSFKILLGFTPFLVLITIIALFAPMLVGGWSFSFEAFMPKLEKLDPIKGLTQRVFAMNGLIELIKALAKFSLIGVVGFLYIYSNKTELMMLGLGGINLGLAEAAYHLLMAFLIVSMSTILIASLDVPYQLWEHARKLKMTKQEVKDELKDTEGKPEVKAQIRAMQQQMANQRTMEAVPKADVIITNPTHYAVALKYDPDTMAAPILLAKGTDILAEKIKQVANANNIAIFPAPMLARAIYYNASIDKEIPSGLYLAVAQVLAYVFQLKQSFKLQAVERPDVPKDFDIPTEYRVD